MGKVDISIAVNGDPDNLCITNNIISGSVILNVNKRKYLSVNKHKYFSVNKRKYFSVDKRRYFSVNQCKNFSSTNICKYF